MTKGLHERLPVVAVALLLVVLVGDVRTGRADAPNNRSIVDAIADLQNSVNALQTALANLQGPGRRAPGHGQPDPQPDSHRLVHERLRHADGMRRLRYLHPDQPGVRSLLVRPADERLQDELLHRRQLRPRKRLRHDGSLRPRGDDLQGRVYDKGARRDRVILRALQMPRRCLLYYLHRTCRLCAGLFL